MDFEVFLFPVEKTLSRADVTDFFHDCGPILTMRRKDMPGSSDNGLFLKFLKLESAQAAVAKGGSMFKGRKVSVVLNWYCEECHTFNNPRAESCRKCSASKKETPKSYGQKPKNTNDVWGPNNKTNDDDAWAAPSKETWNAPGTKSSNAQNTSDDGWGPSPTSKPAPPSGGWGDDPEPPRKPTRPDQGRGWENSFARTPSPPPPAQRQHQESPPRRPYPPRDDSPRRRSPSPTRRSPPRARFSPPHGSPPRRSYEELRPTRGASPPRRSYEEQRPRSPRGGSPRRDSDDIQALLRFKDKTIDKVVLLEDRIHDDSKRHDHEIERLKKENQQLRADLVLRENAQDRLEEEIHLLKEKTHLQSSKLERSANEIMSMGKRLTLLQDQIKAIETHVKFVPNSSY